MDLEKRINEALFRQLIANSSIPLVGSAVGSLLVGISQLGSNDLRIVVGWMMTVYVSLGIRIWLTRRCQTKLTFTGYDHHEAMRYAFSTSLSGIVWGLGGLLVKGASPMAMVVTITVIQAMIMGGVLTLGVFPSSFFAFAIPAILPMIFIFAFAGGVENIVLAIYLPIFLVLMSGVALRYNKSLRHTWQLSFEKENLVQALTIVHDDLALLAETDAMTGIANRRRFDNMLKIEFARLRRSRAPLSLIILDVDHFKAYNDTYGHVAGDECLKKIADAFQHRLNRAPELAARYGGEEFAAILPETDYLDAITLAESKR